MDNLKIYKEAAEVPKNAQKEIMAGKLKGKTDINPMWRIKLLTELFGPCGLGWYTQVLERWTERDANESAAWVRIAMYVKFPGTDTWSAPIEGIGGSKQCGKGQGDGINDEAFKMAETDAISVACKKLGFGAKVYWDKDDTKYSQAAAPRKMVDQNVEDGAPTLADAVNEVRAAKSQEELTAAWNKWKATFGNSAELRKAVADSPLNPKSGRTNGNS